MQDNVNILKLPKAPLQEVVFEVRWELDSSEETNHQYDEGYEAAIGLLHSIIQKDFPVLKQKLPKGMPLPNNIMNYQVNYQYWSGENKMPVLQLGPGIFTVNETEANYEWEKQYFPLIKKALAWLIRAYREKEMKFNFANLRYIDKINISDYKFTNWLNFVNDNLNFNISNEFNAQGELKQFNFKQVFSSQDESDLQITVASGKDNKNQDILIWEISMIKIASFNIDSIIKWLEQSHTITSQLFKEICKNDFFNSFK